MVLIESSLTGLRIDDSWRPESCYDVLFKFYLDFDVMVELSWASLCYLILLKLENFE